MTRAALLVACFALLPAAAPAGGAAADAEPPTAAETLDAFHRALAAGDRAGALALLDPGVVIFESGGAELSRDEYAAHHLAADMEFAGASERTVVERRSGGEGDAAWVLTTSRTRGTFRGRPVASAGVETAVLRRTPEGWLIVHLHWSARNLEPAAPP